MLPIGFGYIEGVTHDDEPHGTTTLCGAQSARRLGPGAVQAASSERLTARPRWRMAAARPSNHLITLGADKAYDVADFVANLRQLNVTPHAVQNTTNRRSTIEGRTTRHPGSVFSGRVRKRIEEVFGWTKEASGFRKTHHRGLARVGGCSP